MPQRNGQYGSQSTLISGIRLRSSLRHGGALLGTLVVLGVLTVIGLIGYQFWGSSTSKDTTAMLVPVVSEPFTLDLTEKGELESSGSAEVRSEVKSSGTTGNAILKIVPEATNVQVGDFLFQLDASKLESELTAQQISVNSSQALVVQAQATYETALIAKREYLEGTFTQEQQTLQSEEFVAEENLRRAQQYLLYSRRLAASGYITQLQLDADSFAVENAKNALSSSKNKLRVLQEFTKAKMLKQLESDIASSNAIWEAEKKSYELEANKLKDLEDQIAKCTVTAPSAGQVKYAHKIDGRGNVDFLIEEGALVREGQIVIRLPDPSQMRVKVNVNEALLKSLQEGLSASIRSVSLEDTVLLGVVEKINQYSEPSSFRRGDVKEFGVFVKVEQPDGRLLPGMSAEVTIHCLSLPRAIQVPVQAIYTHGDQAYCFVQNKSGLEAREIKPGPSNETFVVVESGLVEGEMVALNPKAHKKEVDLEELTAAESQQVIRKVRRASDAKAPSKLPESKSRPAADKASGGPPAGGGDMAGQMMARMDKNADGQISAEEWPSAMKEHFASTDTNGDGQISRSELTAGIAKMRAAGGGPPGGGGSPRGEGAAP